MIRPQPHLAALSAYSLADMSASEGETLISLSQNESLRGPSPKALAAARAALDGAALYPDPDWTDLRHAIAQLHGLDADSILCANGSLELIAALATTFAGPGRAVLAPAHAYPFFRTATQLSGARYDTAAETDLTVCVDALLQAVTPETTGVFVANPGNPTGTRLPRAELERLREGLPRDCLMVVDEAYGEFADDIEPPCWDMVERGNCVVLRSFSKAYGLAGLRAGWGLFPPQVAADLRKSLNPNAVTSATQAAARAALEDQAYMKDTCRMTAELSNRWTGKLTAAGFAVSPSWTNFLLIRFREGAAAAEEELRRDGILLRRQQAAGLPMCLRMTVGPEDAMARAVAALVRWKTEAEA